MYEKDKSSESEKTIFPLQTVDIYQTIKLTAPVVTSPYPILTEN
jgi:hypothetical protein